MVDYYVYPIEMPIKMLAENIKYHGGIGARE
jgi:hypothetical protein